MTINIIGDAPPVTRLETGLWSFDRSFVNRAGDIGFPIGVGIEIYGLTHCGKSTITYGLAGLIAASREKAIALADLEGFDPDFLTSILDNAGYSGDVQNIQEETDEETLNELVSFMYDENYCVGILDSIAAISPIAEQEGSIGEANMGARAFRVGQFTRKCLPIVRKDDSHTIFMINHMYPKFGGRGYTIPGGEVKKYLASITIKVKRVYRANKYEEYPDGSYVIEGKVTKNRWGLKDKVFWLFVLSGKGIHKGLTALYDAYKLKGKPVTLERNIVRIGEESFGHLKKIIEKAQEGDDKFFKPFFEVLRNQEQADEEVDEEQDKQKDEEK
jgi:RecA/RadA recombinase